MEGKKLGILVAVTLILTYLSGKELAAKNNVKSDNNKVKNELKVKPRMDIAFCIDTTGSMQAEIDMVKAKVKELVSKLATGDPTPDVRVGLVAFRDRSDSYVTKVYDFTDDIDKFVKDISNLQARGGGDSPEAVNQALHAAVNELQWDDAKKTSKILFLIGDAGPKEYPNDFKWDQESKKAIAKGIQINTIGCNGLENFQPEKGIDVFKKIAKLADGQFELLAYKQTVTRADGSKSTIVRAGGDSFEVAAESAGDWKEGASRLVKSGKAKRMRSSYFASRRAPMAGAVAGSADGELPAASPYVSGSVDRKVNNLDSILIRAAKKKAEKDLSVKYDE